MPTVGGRPIPRHPARRLTIMLTSRDHARHVSLMVKLLQRARRAGLSGGTALRAQEGFGISGRVHRRHLLSEDAPLTLVFVDDPGRIESFLGDVEGLLEDVVFVSSDVDVIDS
jgi:PII-like signaling protein